MNSYYKIDLVGKRRLWYAISLVVIAAGLFLLLEPVILRKKTGGIRWGIDFTGGGIFRYRFPTNNVPTADDHIAVINQIRTELRKAKVTSGAIQIQISGGDELYLRTQARDDAERSAHARAILGVLEKSYPGVTELGSEVVGPVIGKDLAAKAIIGVTLGCMLIMIWIWIRYNAMGEGHRYAVAGIIALVHDVIVMSGLFALACKLSPRIEADSSFVAALLTVVGYSINDSVIIFDRIRENLHLRRRDPFALVVNDSLLQTMARSINTVLTVELTLFALFFLGGETIHSFILAMIIGITVGAYSSICVAASILVSWKALDEKKKPVLVPARKKEPKPEPSVAVTPPTPLSLPLSAASTTTTTTANAPGEGDQVEIAKGTPAPAVSGVTQTKKKKPGASQKRGKRKRRY